MRLFSGYEKFWTALLSGGFVSAVQVLNRAIVSGWGVVPAPTPDMIAAAMDGLVVALAAAFGALLATNSQPTNISVPAEPVAQPEVIDPTAPAPGA